MCTIGLRKHAGVWRFKRLKCTNSAKIVTLPLTANVFCGKQRGCDNVICLWLESSGHRSCTLMSSVANHNLSPTEPSFSGPTFSSAPPADQCRGSAQRRGRRLSCPISPCASVPSVALSAGRCHPTAGRRLRRTTASPTAPGCSAPTDACWDLPPTVCPTRRRCCGPKVAWARSAGRPVTGQQRRLVADCLGRRRHCASHDAPRPPATTSSQSSAASTLPWWRPVIQPTSPLSSTHLTHAHKLPMCRTTRRDLRRQKWRRCQVISWLRNASVFIGLYVWYM